MKVTEILEKEILGFGYSAGLEESHNKLDGARNELTDKGIMAFANLLRFYARLWKQSKNLIGNKYYLRVWKLLHDDNKDHNR